MPHKLGEVLVRRGHVSPAVLLQGLEAQSLHSTRIGTALVQLEAVSLDNIGVCLSMQHGVPLATRELLEAVEEQVLAAVPKEVCEEFRVFPLRLEGKLLHVAMMDPGRSTAGKLSFRLGMPVQPHVIPELRLVYQLEHRLGIPRDPRYLRAPDGREKDPGRRKYLESRVEPDPTPADSVPDLDDGGLLFLDQYTKEVPALKIATPAETATTALAAAASADQVRQVLVQPLLEQPTTSVLCFVRQKIAIACCVSNAAVSDRELQGLTVALDTHSIMTFAFENKRGVRARGEADPLHHKIVTFLGWMPPGEVCVMPVVVKGTVIDLLCIQLAQGATFDPDELRLLRRISEQAAAAYLRIIEQRQRG